MTPNGTPASRDRRSASPYYSLSVESHTGKGDYGLGFSGEGLSVLEESPLSGIEDLKQGVDSGESADLSPILLA